MTITCQTINDWLCLKKDHNCCTTIILLPFTIAADFVHFLLYLITYPIICILSPIWVTLLYPLFSKRFHYMTNDCNQGCIKFVLTNGHDEDDGCNAKFYLHFFVDLILNLEVLIWDIFAVLFVLILLLVNIASLPIILIIAALYFMINVTSYIYDPNSFMKRADIQFFSTYYRSNNENEYLYSTSEKISMCKIILLIPYSLLGGIIAVVLESCVSMILLFSPIIILLILIHILLTIPLYFCSNISCVQMIIAPAVMLTSQIMSSSCNNSDDCYDIDNIYERFDDLGAPYKPTVSDYMCGRYE